jgi:hypothetical protein
VSNEKPGSTWGISPVLTKWLESSLITCGVLVAGYYLNGSDPFFVTSRFPWLWFAPLLVALRYGLAAGVFSVSAITVAMLLMIRSKALPYPFPTDFMLGGTLLVMVSGQFSAVWNMRLRRADKLSEHAVERAQQISRAYFMVRLSHDRLEQNLISKPVTLRQAMSDLRLHLVRHGGKINREVAGELLSILSHYCDLDSASIYPVVGGGLGPEPVASCGKGAPFEPDDLLLRSAMESGNTAYQSVTRMQPGQRSSYLVASPMRSSSGDLMAMLLVTEMPFLSLQRETLQIMGVLLSYCVEHAFTTARATEILDVYPDCPPVFASELIKMHKLNKDLGIESTLTVLKVHTHPRDKEIAMTIEKKQRGLDHVWRVAAPTGDLLITLMPFSSVTGGEGYLARIAELLRSRFGVEMGDGVVTSRLLQVVAAVSPLEHLHDLLKREVG